VGLFVPARRRGHEILDDDSIDAATRVRSLGDVRTSNRVFGGLRAALIEVEAALAAADGQATLLDVGTGLGDIPAALRRRIAITTIGTDVAIDLLRAARPSLSSAVCASATALPFRDHSIDVVLCSQLLHHFADDQLSFVISELNRVARRRVVIADLRRSWIAAAGFWLASFPLSFHAVTRHDGVVSVFRGFTTRELHRAVTNAVAATPAMHRRLGFRLTASWNPVIPSAAKDT
jgi:SAM-dependent methyltransferase